MGVVSQLTEITTSVQSYIVAPLAAFGIGGFEFNCQGEAIATLSADITDHYSEDNKALQDHIAIHPKKITLKGYVGEVTYNKTEGGPFAPATLLQKLSTINAFLPRLTAGAVTVQQAITDPTSLTLSSVSNLYALVKNLFGAGGQQQNQQNAYNYFKSLMETATLMGVQTPWEFMTNMAIESIVAIQDEKSIYISDFAVTFKQIRIATVQTTAYSAGNTGGVGAPGGPNYQGDAALQGQNPVPQGNVPGVVLPYQALPGAQGNMTGAGALGLNPALSNIWGGS